jgi:hypothetical protein
LHLTKELLGKNGLKEGAARTAGEQPLPGLDHGKQREQLENNHRADLTTDTSRRNGFLYSVMPFGTNSLKEEAM